MERKLIRAEELEEKLLKMGFYPALVRGMLENMKPVDAAEVVRCKGCGYWTPIDEGYGYCTHPRFCAGLYFKPKMNMNGFCSCGERRADNGC